MFISVDMWRIIWLMLFLWQAESFCKLIDSKVYNLVILGNTLYKGSGKEIIEKTTIIDSNAIMVYINRIRSKIEDDPTKPEHLVTVRGKGYRLNAKQ